MPVLAGSTLMDFGSLGKRGGLMPRIICTIIMVCFLWACEISVSIQDNSSQNIHTLHQQAVEMIAAGQTDKAIAVLEQATQQAPPRAPTKTALFS
jgi:outer membrane protein assembly factor BamD (BamD/ComL family)